MESYYDLTASPVLFESAPFVVNDGGMEKEGSTRQYRDDRLHYSTPFTCAVRDLIIIMSTSLDLRSENIPTNYFDLAAYDAKTQLDPDGHLNESENLANPAVEGDTVMEMNGYQEGTKELLNRVCTLTSTTSYFVSPGKGNHTSVPLSDESPKPCLLYTSPSPRD